MHIHGYGYCDICLPKDVQEQVLKECKALLHRGCFGDRRR